MQNKIKNIIVVICFCVALIITLINNCLAKDIEISKIERRMLASFPQITKENIINGKAMEEFDKYAIDQFVGRDFFRKIKSFWSINIFRQKDDNRYFEKDGAIYKIEYPLNIGNLNKSTDKIKNIYDKYLQNMNVYISIIPDKNYYLDDEYLKMDYNALVQSVQEKLPEMKYIDIFSTLELNDYYKTDIHWKQECLIETVNKFQEEIGLEKSLGSKYKLENVGEFYGTYYGRLGIDVEPDEMCILTNSNLENCKTYNYETNKENKIYDKKETNDRYDIYVSGATPLIVINNLEANTDKELLLFRDSFGSSLAPLLVQNYKKITLIDIRYMQSSLLNEFIEFENQDVLFLYSTLVLNQNILK